MIRKSIFAAIFLLIACGEKSAPLEDKPVAGGAEAGCLTRAYDHIGGPISLIDHTGASVTEADFRGAPSLVYFGFTYCPDICPASLVTIDRALRRLPDSVKPPRTILISIDPERDTPEAMSAYISTNAFPDDIVGLTGTVAAVTAAADAFIAPFEKIEAPESLAEYTMDHTSLIYLMDEDWTLKTFFTHEATAESMGDCLTQHVE